MGGPSSKPKYYSVTDREEVGRRGAARPVRPDCAGNGTCFTGRPDRTAGGSAGRSRHMEGKMNNVNNYCIAVKECGDDIVFLRKIVKGGADKS